MIRSHRSLVLLVPAVLGVLLALPGRAQQASPTLSMRFAFADTTLLRDTLNLKFDELFPLADSLRVTPDTLRALSIRYRYSLRRLVRVADSLAVPMDSLGAVLERERFNPLAATGKDVNDFRYTSTYNIAQTSSSWVNASDYNRVTRSLFVRNTTNIQMDRYKAGGSTSLRQTRSAVTETGWRFSPDFSLGGRLNLDRYDTSDPGSVNNEKETSNKAELSLRTRQKPATGLSTDLNLFSGVLDVSNSRQVKRGLSGDLNGRVRYTRAQWFTHDLSAQVTGNLARTRLPTAISTLNTRDWSRNLSGTLGLFTNAPIAANLAYRSRGGVVETPLDSGRVQQVRNENNGVDLTVSGRRDADHQLNVTGSFGTSKGAQSTNLSALNTRRDMSFSSDGRYLLAGFLLEGRFSAQLTVSRFPKRGANGGYGESLNVRSVNVTATRLIGTRLRVVANGTVDLSRYRYYLIGRYPTPPVNRDQYRQSYRTDVQYTVSQDLNSGVALEVSRNLGINIPSASTGSNTEGRTYRAEWRWSYRLLRGLTATQRNAITADYLYYTFRRKDDRLTLLYNTVTTLNAVLSPRFTVDLTHNATYRPSGNYTLQADGLEAFSRADENKDYTLQARASYTPMPGISLTFEPNYLASNRSSTVDGTLSPQRRDRSLNFSGGANLNVPIGAKGRLTGNIARTFRTSSAVNWVKGVPTDQPGAAQDFWNGSLQVSWEL